MPPPIAFTGRLDAADESLWLATLRTALPEAEIRPLRELAATACAAVDIAIVANPDPAELARLPNLAWIHSLWAGAERLVAELGDRVPIVRLVDPDLARVMGEAVLAWTYFLSRDMPAYAQAQRAHRWVPRPYRSPSTTPVGLLGLGTLGQVAARRLGEAGFPVIGWSRTAKTIDGVETVCGDTGLAALLARATITVCLLPLTPDTRGLLDAARLALMPRGAALINFARGPIVDTRALCAALDTGALSHAVLDVFDNEPLEATSPLWDHPAISVLPHVSAPTNPETAAAIVAGNIRRFWASGTLPGTVDIARGY
ncbi:glyoxylate/hydroxypyruvate reductase A [Beijerinckia sp. L45]|uniref:2-hydroxyacid dehydrogenase n=1 Tax=Beijerinckia sp. L45 TaxID=1641855 RepID=UPI00131B22B4|nr:glyoxylate/hydroxypyruvate reductase A [Beijerinckia sp. L45]